MLKRFLHFTEIINFVCPIIDILSFVKSEDNLVQFILYFEMMRFLFVFRFIRSLQCSIFDVIIGIVILIFSVEVNVNVIVAHDSHILFPHLSHCIFYVNHADFGSFIFYFWFFNLSGSCSFDFMLLLLSKAITHF